jgi:hypothetical protein
MRQRLGHLLLLVLCTAVLGPACEGPTGPQGPPGPVGPSGPPGSAGPASGSQVQHVSFTRDCSRISGESWTLTAVTSACRIAHPECLAKVVVLCGAAACNVQATPVTGTPTQTEVSTADASIATHTLICVLR